MFKFITNEPAPDSAPSTSPPSIFRHELKDNPLSQHSLARAAFTRSYNPLTRVHLRESFYEDMLREGEGLGAGFGQMRPGNAKALTLALVQADRRRVAVERAKLTGLPLVYELTLRYVPLDARGPETTQPLMVCALPECELSRLAVALFSLPAEMLKTPSLLPRPRLFDSEGNEILANERSSNERSSNERLGKETRKAVTVKYFADNHCSYVAFGAYLFRTVKCVLVPSRMAMKSDQGTPSSSLPQFYVKPEGQYIKCDCCDIRLADCQVTDCLLLPLSPSFLCSECYRELLPRQTPDTPAHGYLPIVQTTLPGSDEGAPRTG